jgi:hypothetical protein
VKLRFNGDRWCIGEREPHCGEQVRIEATSIEGKRFLVYGRFELTSGNNPVFYTMFGVLSHTHETEFDTREPQ